MLTGGLAVLIGPVGAVVAGGGGAIIITAMWSRMFPKIRAARTFDPPERLQKQEAAVGSTPSQTSREAIK